MRADTCHRCQQDFMAEDLAMQQEILAGHAEDETPVYTYMSFCRACWMQMMNWLSVMSSRLEKGG